MKGVRILLIIVMSIFALAWGAPYFGIQGLHLTNDWEWIRLVMVGICVMSIIQLLQGKKQKKE